MQISYLEITPRPEWRAGLDALSLRLGQTPGWTMARPGRPADAWLISAGDSSDYARQLEACGDEQRGRTILLGVALPWPQGRLHHPAQTLPALLETYGVAGAFTPPALVEWSEMPSYFAGPIDRMPAFQTNCIKAMQSERYCFWGRTRGDSLAAFLIEYLTTLSVAEMPAT